MYSALRIFNILNIWIEKAMSQKIRDEMYFKDH